MNLLAPEDDGPPGFSSTSTTSPESLQFGDCLDRLTRTSRSWEGTKGKADSLFHLRTCARPFVRLSIPSHMLEDIRKHTGLFIIVLVAIFIGLIFMESAGGGAGGGGPVVAQTDDFTVSYKEVQEEAGATLQLAARLRDNSIRGGSFEGFSDLSAYMTSLQSRAEQAPTTEIESLAAFMVSRRFLQDAIEEYGVQAGEKEVQEYIKEKLFADRNGLFDQASYDAFVENGLQGLGMNLRDFNEFVGELLSFKKFSEVLAAGVQGNSTSAQENYSSEAQSLDITTFSYDLATFKQELEPSDEELKSYWEENKGRYLSEPKRKVHYVLATPDFDTLLEEKKAREAEASESGDAPEEEEEEEEVVENASEETAESPLPTDSEEPMTEAPTASEASEVPAAEVAPAAEPAPTTMEEVEESILEQGLPNIADLAQQAEGTALTDLERKKAVDELGLVIEEVWLGLKDLVDEEGQAPNLKPVVAKVSEDFGVELEVKETDLVSVSELPPGLKGPDRGDSRKTIEQRILEARVNEANPMDAVVDVPVGAGKESWLVFYVSEVADPQELPFEEAKNDVREDYIDEKGKELMREKIEEAHEALVAAAAEDKNLTEVAASLNLKTANHEGFTNGSQLPGEANPQEVFRLAAQTPVGELSAAELLQPGEQRAVIVQVQKREFVENDVNKDGLTRAVDSQRDLLRRSLVEHWFQARWEESDVEFPEI
ncbi:MAG: SurA N-terminal domain-containing protein [Verrucomicrobiota bacterium JB023]|nr:SurA N-terminal domain-containing protein [Verrucomicrobiota bacterium JB023]